MPFINEKLLLTFLQSGCFAEALQHARLLVQHDPNNALGWKVLGSLLVQQGDNDAAQAALERALQIAPNDAEILNNLGQIYQNKKQLSKALNAYRKAAKLNPDYAEIWYNQGLILQKLGQWDYAFKSYKKAIAIRPNYIKAYNNNAALLHQLNYLDEALETYNKILEINPNDAETLNHRSSVLRDLNRLNEALVNLDKALIIDPSFAVALVNRGNILTNQGRLQEAIENYDRALSVQPDLLIASQNRLMCLNYIANYPKDMMFTEHRAFGQLLENQTARLPTDITRNRDANRRLRLGFVSGDFRQHSVAFFLLPVLEHLDRQCFEIYCYSTNPSQDEWTKKFQNLADSWIETAIMESHELAERIRADAIDILFDLSGYTRGSALAIFAAKPAPIQVTWLGYPNTTGLTTIDYRFVDAITDPIDVIADTGYTEKLIRLPHSFLCYRPDTLSPEVTPAPCIQKKRITFGSFNNLAKITPEVVELWAAILNAVPNSCLRLKSNFVSESEIWEKLIADFFKLGIKRERLELQTRMFSYYEHLAAYSNVDISLDTFPYHGTTTTCESLLMGVPVITLIGDRHASRVGASLLTQIGLTELITTSPKHYIDTAVKLALNESGLIKLRSELREKLKNSSLCDEINFTRNFEKALRQMWHLWCDGQSSQAFNIENLKEKLNLPLFSIMQHSNTPQSRQISKLRALSKALKQPPLSPEQQKCVEFFTNAQYLEAISQAQQLTLLNSEDSFNWKLLGTSFVKAEHYEEAIQPLLEAIRLKAESDSLNSLGFALAQLGRSNEAISCYERSIEIDPEYAQAYNNFGIVYRDLGNLDRALDYYKKALDLDPDYAEAYINRGCALEEMGLLKEAEDSCKQALDLAPNSYAALNNLGKVQMLLGEHQASYQSYKKALEIKPDLKQSFNNMLFSLNYQDNLSKQEIFEKHRDFEYKQACHIKKLPSLYQQVSDKNRILRLGFISGDFKFHSVAFFLFPIIENLDRQQFQLFCYSMSYRSDAATKLFRKHADGWLDCLGLTEFDLAERIRADRIDLLFDLSGHTSPNALFTFAARPAPIQISWIGYPNTTGLSAIDYRLVDELTDPLGEADRYHSEHLIRLPTGFLCYRPWSTAFELSVSTLPSLHNGYITFGSFNNFCKITPTTLNLWIQILKAVPNSRLLLKTHTSKDTQIWNHLLEQCKQAGIATERLAFLERAPSYTEHLEQYNEIDIALDTYPYNGTTTTCEALFMGVPVITLAGDCHAARVGSSLMNRVKLSDFVAQSNEEYIAIAVRWSKDLDALVALRACLREQLERSPLRDEIGFTRILEIALRQMWSLWCSGESPRVFDVNQCR